MRKRGRENSLTCLLAWSMELSMGNTNRLFLAVILLTKDLNELCGEVGTHIHSMTRSFGRFLVSIYLIRLFIDIIWKWILQCVWRILFTKKEKIIFNQLPFPALILSILFDTEHISSKFLDGRRALSPSRMYRCLLFKLLWFLSTQDWYGVISVWVQVLVRMVRIWMGR